MNVFLESFIYLITSCIMIFIAIFVFNKIAVFKIKEELVKANYTAIITFAGYLLGIAIVLIGAYIGPNLPSFKMDYLMYVAYSFVGIVLMSLSGIITKKIMLNKFDNSKELLQDNNIGTAMVYFGFYLAHGLVISACVNGEIGGILSSICYYILSVIFMFIFLHVYDVITPYSIHKELEKDNYSVGIVLAGNIIAIGIILMKATLGDVSGWINSLITYLIDVSVIFLLLPSVRYLFSNFMMSKINLNEEIEKDNKAVAIAEAICIVVFALLLFFMVDFCGNYIG